MKQLLILSGKGGTGKTTVASAFIHLSKAMAFADCDVDAPNLHLILQHSDESPQRTIYHGLPKAVIDLQFCINCGLCEKNCRFEAIHPLTDLPGYAVDSFSCEGCSVCEVVCPVGAVSLKPVAAGELKLYRENGIFSTARLNMGSGTSGKLVTEVKKQLKAAVGEKMALTGRAVDLAIFDGSPGIGCPVIASISGVDLVLVVAEPSVSGVSDLKRIVETARQFQTPVMVCINKYDTNRGQTQEIETLCETLNLPLAGRIPFDGMVVEATNQGRSIATFFCPASKAVNEVYAKVMHQMFETLPKQAPGFHGVPVVE